MLFQYQAMAEPLEPSLTTAPPILSWFQPAQEPNNPKRRHPPTLIVSPLEPSLTVDPPILSWFQPLQEPNNPKRRLFRELTVAPLEPSLTVAPPILSWEPILFQATIPKRQPFCEAFWAVYVVAAPIVADISWMQPIQQPVIPPPRMARMGYEVKPLETNLPVPVPASAIRIRIQHNEGTIDVRTRVHEQQVSKLVNELARKGELSGTINNPSLGYNADNPTNWPAGTPTTVKAALDTLAGQTYSGAYSVLVSSNWSIPYPVTVVSALDVLAARVKTLEISGGGGGSPDAIIAQAGGGGARISGLQANPDIDVAGGNDDEFNAALSGWTTLGSLDTLNSNVIKSHLHMAKTTSAIQLDGIYKACPAFPFTATLKISDKLQANDRECGLFVAEASPGKLYSFGTIYNAVWNKGIWTDRVTRTGNSNGDLSVSIDVKYLRIVVTNSTSIAVYWSLDGFVWTSAGSGINPLGGSTVGAVGIYVTAYAASPAEGVFDWVRFT